MPALRPRRGYGAGPTETTHGSNHIRYLGGDAALRLSTDAPVGYVLEGRTYRVESDQHFFLGPDEPFLQKPFTAEALALGEEAQKTTLWVIGGAQIYAQALPLADRVEVTEIGRDFDGDAYAPKLDHAWVEAARSDHVSESGLPYSFVSYVRAAGRG